MLGCFQLVARRKVTSRFANGRVNKVCESYRAIIVSQGRIWELLFKIDISCLVECFCIDPVLAVLVLARSYKVMFDTDSCIERYSYDSPDSVVMRGPEYTGMS